MLARDLRGLPVTPSTAISVEPAAALSAPGPAAIDLDIELAALPDMTSAQLRRRWYAVARRPVPRIKHTLLRHALAWELQAAVYGGLSRRSAQRLAQMAAAGDEQPATTKLTREWKGTLHTVTIEADSTIHWNGKCWNSLSQVARTITGTRWSGPLFFGLRQGKAA
jgi:hypothetical protein